MDWKGKKFNDEIQEITLKKNWLVLMMIFFMVRSWNQNSRKNNRLYVESQLLEHFKGKNDNELVYLKNGLFKIIDYPNLLQFELTRK
jgi:hypothetical protein